MSKRITILCLLAVVILTTGFLVYGLKGGFVKPADFAIIERPAKIYPDYNSTVIPPNISPLNFMVKEPGTYYAVRIYGRTGRAIELGGKSPKIIIPAKRWHTLLENNKGTDVHFEIFVRTAENRWVRFAPITNRVANEAIDGYAVYRRMPPSHYPDSGRVGIYQRNLNNFDETLILDHHRYGAGCVNCHTLWENQAGKVMLGVRCEKGGQNTILIEGGKASRINAKFGYTTWHPSGRLAAFSINKLPIIFHTAGDKLYDTIDTDSAIAYYDCRSKTIKTSPEFSRKENLETWPAWSGDGRYLYFCNTKKTWTDLNEILEKGYEKIKYDLVRISYDVNEDRWGNVETALSSQQTGLSISMPRISPDNRWLVFCMGDYGYFPPWEKSSDLYIIDLKAAEQTGRFEYRRLKINSEKSEAWHSWSSNSRWLIFSSKRDYGDFTRSYISYVDEKGRVYKPFVLPQKDPEFYAYCLDTFNTPEFAVGEIVVRGKQLVQAIFGPAGTTVAMPITMATPKIDAVPVQGQTLE